MMARGSNRAAPAVRLKMRRDRLEDDTSQRRPSPPARPLSSEALIDRLVAMAGPLSITDLLEKQRKEKEEASKVRPLAEGGRRRSLPPTTPCHRGD